MAAIQGHENVLTPEAERLSSFYNTFKCPRCQCGLQKEFDSRHMFADQDSMIARSLLRCTNCRYLIDPHSNVIIQYGDASKMPVETIPILGAE